MTNIKGNPKRSLPDEVVRLMRKKHYKNGMKISEIYNYFKDHWNVSMATVSRAVNYKTYKGVK